MSIAIRTKPVLRDVLPYVFALTVAGCGSTNGCGLERLARAYFPAYYDDGLSGVGMRLGLTYEETCGVMTGWDEMAGNPSIDEENWRDALLVRSRESGWDHDRYVHGLAMGAGRLPAHALLTSQPNDEERESHMSALQNALAQLWTQAISGMVLRHPDNRVTAELQVRTKFEGCGKAGCRCTYLGDGMNQDGVEVRIMLRGMRDARERPDGERPMINVKSGGEFVVYIRSDRWHGTRAARAAIFGLWTEYMMHEAAESCRVPSRHGDDGTAPLYNPHDDEDLIGTAMYNRNGLGPSGDVRGVIALALGTYETERLLSSEMRLAERQLQAALDEQRAVEEDDETKLPLGGAM